MSKSSLRVLTLTFVALTAGLASARTASAQSYLSGSFKLPYEVQWRNTVLPPGDYTITMTTYEEPALLRQATGAVVGVVQAVAVRKPWNNAPTGLFVALIGNRREVRSFNWKERGIAFVYAPLTPDERTSLASLRQPEAEQPTRMASR